MIKNIIQFSFSAAQRPKDMILVVIFKIPQQHHAILRLINRHAREGLISFEMGSIKIVKSINDTFNTKMLHWLFNNLFDFR